MSQPKITLDQKNGKLILSTSPWHKITLTTAGRIYSPWYYRAYKAVYKFIRWTLLAVEYLCLSLLIYLLGYRKGDED